MDVSSRARPNPQQRRKPPVLRRVSIAAAFALALVLPAAQTVQAVEIYYARAIGQEYLPERSPPPPTPEQSDRGSPPELPGLGAEAGQRQSPPRGMGLWGKVLVGALVVVAMAAVANSGGGASGQVTVGTGDGGGGGGGPPPGGGNTPGTGGGGDGGNTGGDPDGGENVAEPTPLPEPIPDVGGGGIEIDDGDDARDDDRRGSNRGRGRGRGGDD